MSSAKYTHSCHGGQESEGGPVRTPRLHRSRSTADVRRRTLTRIDTSFDGQQPTLGQAVHHPDGSRRASVGAAAPNFVNRNGVAQNTVHNSSSPYARLCQQRGKPKMDYPYPASFASARPALCVPEAISGSPIGSSPESTSSQIMPSFPFTPMEESTTLSQIMSSSADKHIGLPSLSSRPRDAPIIPMPRSPLGSYLIRLHPLLF